MSATKANPATGASSDSPLKEKKKKGIVLPPVDHGYAWVIVTAATIIFMFSIGVFRTQSVFLEPVRKTFNVTHGTMTLMGTFMSIASQLLTLPGNVMSEWLGPRVNVIAAGVLGLLCYLICALAICVRIFPLYFASYVLLQGAAFALCYSPVIVTVNRYFKVYRPLASSIALGGVSIGTMIIPNVLKALYSSIGLRWILIGAGICMVITIPIAFFLRTITMEQLAALDAQQKLAAAAPPAETEEKIELGTLNKNDLEVITPVGGDEDGNKLSETEKEKHEDGVDDPEVKKDLLESTEDKSANPDPVVEPKEVKVEKKKSSIAAAFSYFKLMPSLFKNPIYLIHALHFAVMMCVDMIFMSVTFDSFLDEMKTPSGLVFTSRTAFAVGNFVGRFASGLFVVMPVFIAKCSRKKEGADANASGTSCYDTVKKYLTVRILYCGASGFFCLAGLLLAIAGMSGGSAWSIPLVFVYILVGVSGGCLFSQFPVVLAELVGLQRLAAGHALFMLIQVPVNGLQFLSGFIKQSSGSWAISYWILFILCTAITVVNCVSLLLGGRIRRLLSCGK